MDITTIIIVSVAIAIISVSADLAELIAIGIEKIVLKWRKHKNI